MGEDGAWISDIQKYFGADFSILDVSYIELINQSHPSRTLSAIIDDDVEVEAIYKRIWNYKIPEISEQERFPPGGALKIVFHLKNDNTLSLHEASGIICSGAVDSGVYFKYETVKDSIDLYQFLLNKL